MTFKRFKPSKITILVVPSGTLVARVFLLPLPIGTACFSAFFSSRARFCGMGWGGVRWDVDVHLHFRHIYDATSRMGWGGVGWDVDVHLHFRHNIYDATSRMGWGGVGWDVDVHLHFRHIYDATSRMGWGGVGWGVGKESKLIHKFLAIQFVFL